MPSYATLIIEGGAWIWLLFVFALGACAGSLTNVLVYRLPLGLSVVTPPSRCPACRTRLTWRENIPVLGWLFLRGRCRFCRSRISPEYPLVEAFIGFLFAATFFLWYIVPQHAEFLGIDWAAIRPEWAHYDASFDRWPRQSWPMFIVLLVLIASLVAMSLVDLKTYTIPLQIPWFATATALLFHVGYAIYLSSTARDLRYVLPVSFQWSLPTPRSWWWVGASIGGVLGLIIGNLLFHFGLIRRSFADYADWEKQHLGEHAPPPAAGSEPAPTDAPASDHPAPVDASTTGFPWLRRFGAFLLIFAAIVTALSIASNTLGPAAGLPRWSGLLAGILIGPLIAALFTRPAQPSPDSPPDASNPPAAAMPTTAGDAPADTWIQYPHARREMVKEILFLTPAIALFWLGGIIAESLVGGAGSSGGAAAAPIPLWLSVLAGVLLGYLIGGGVVWAARIAGSIGFGKEALGLGDVHLMAAVGACCGWIDATLAFPLAAVVGLYWVVIHAASTRHMPRAMQFGPYLAAATLLVIFGKPLIELGLTRLLNIQPPDLPVNLP